ncbi:MAG: PDZ domain-containing protein, partial [Calditrichaeota bacterium]|nr:PDZ domain-containing protein [Calditrichota bacterium]
NRGNSGGPLVNAEGDLIGMNTMIFTEGGGGSIGLGFAIPSNKLNRLFEDLKGRGKIERDFWIGFQVGEVTRLIARSLRLNDLHGAVVTDVESGSPAEKAGLEPADVIVAAQGRRIESPYDLLTLLRNADLRVGDMLKLTIWRSGSTEEREIRLGKR